MSPPLSLVFPVAVILLSFSPVGVLAALMKPTISPSFPDLGNRLMSVLKAPDMSITAWHFGWLPLRCKAEAESKGLSPYDMEVFNVQYSDCDAPWVMCRHSQANMSQADMADRFGRMPVRMRQWGRHMIALPSDERSAYTYSDLGDTIVLGDGQGENSITLWIHELAHTLDHNAAGTNGTGDFSASPVWTGAYEADSAISDSYAATNQAENFCQETVIAIFDKLVAGGIGSVQPSWRDVRHQYSAAQKALGNILQPGGKCERRWNNDSYVCMGPDAKCKSAPTRRAYPSKPAGQSKVPRFSAPLKARSPIQRPVHMR